LLSPCAASIPEDLALHVETPQTAVNDHRAAQK